MPGRPYKYFIAKGESGQFILDSRRPPVSHNLRSTQGNHATAFAMIVRSITRSIPYENMNDYVTGLITRKELPIYNHMFDLISGINTTAIKYSHLKKFEDDPKIQEIIDKQTKNFEGRIGCECRDVKNVIGTIELINERKINEQRILVEKLGNINIDDISNNAEQKKLNEYLALEDKLTNYLANEYLKIRNKQVFVSFPNQGNLDNVVCEGAKVCSALKQLDSYSLHRPLNERERVNLVNEVTKNLLNTFWHPHIPDKN